jgi:hypothetical protein
VASAVEARRGRSAPQPTGPNSVTDPGAMSVDQLLQGVASAGPAQPPAQPQEAPAPQRPSLYSLAPGVTGMVPAGAMALQGVVGQSGMNVPFTAGLAERRQLFSNAQNELIRALSINPRFPVAEMERIRREINISPGAFTDGRTLQERMRSIDTYLAGRLVNEDRAAQDASLPVETRRAAAQAANDIRNFTELLGVPRERQGEGTRAAPAGIDPRLWGVMTPEERALWQN